MKLKSYVDRKRLAIELVLFDIIAIQLAAFLAILTRFELGFIQLSHCLLTR